MSEERDDDAPAIEAGPDTHDDDAGTEGAAAAGVGDEPVVGNGPRYRTVSDKTRALFKQAGETLKKQFDAGEALDEYEPAIAAPSDKGTPATPAAGLAAPQGTPPVPPPVPSLSAPDTSAAVKDAAREKALTDREAALTKREAALTALENLRERYLDSPAAAIAEVVKLWTGIEDVELADEMTDLISHISADKLGLTLPQDIKTRTETRKATRAVKAWKADQAKREAEQAKKSTAEQEAAAERQRDEMGLRGVSMYLPQLKSEKGDHQFPFLMAEEAPHEVVWEVIKEQFVRAGKPADFKPDVVAAAKLANDYIEKRDRQHFDKRRHLLNPTAANAAPAAGSEPQGDRPSHRSSTLTNRTTAPVTPSSSTSDADVTGEDRRQRSLRKMRERNGASAT